ncbi:MULTISPECIES: cupin domain-containing protein [Mycobacteriaceae]|uniref:cupin domain-containing protein n=1 Tax=Mycobacteriaceae TaxID=1762 RepID=UPI001E2D08DB|nr:MULTISPECIES: cupin domain-containing protein [Mycobacteriaceae]MCC9182519.1 cupin domain-containing protein [Mycolicibacterium mageritense]
MRRLMYGGLAAMIVASPFATLLSPATALATPPVGASAVTLAKQTIDGMDYIVSELTIAPGGSTGWHTNEGELYGVVKAGTVNHFIVDCTQDGVHSAGDPITDPAGPDHVHTVRNLGNVPAVLDITYVDSAGAPTTDSAPNPGCPFE